MAGKTRGEERPRGSGSAAHLGCEPEHRAGGLPVLEPNWLNTLENWIREMRDSLHLPPVSPPWSPDSVDIALSASGSSAPGPDGIPYEAYNRCLSSSRILNEAAKEIYTKGLLADIPRGFNHSNLFFHPKKAKCTRPVYGEVFTCENTRPLSVVDTSNRLLALAF